MNSSASRSAERAVPCLNSNNCIETANSGEIKQLPSQYENRKADTLNEFSTSYKKSTTALEMNVKAFIEAFGLNKVGFLTLTFADDVTSLNDTFLNTSASTSARRKAVSISI